MYFSGMFNLEKFDDSARYAVFDDFEDWSRFYNYKQWLGAQEEFELSDKYMRKRTVKWGKPCIVLSNQDPDFKDQHWISENCITCFIQNKLF
jgi:hypothetical protein